MKTSQLVIALLLLGGIPRVFSQTIAANNITYIYDVEKYFSQGVQQYRLENYQQAKNIFLSLIKQYPLHQRITAVYLMLGKTYYKLGQYKKAIARIQELIAAFPHSNYVDDGHYAMGCCYYRLNKYVLSVKEFLWLIDYAKDKRLAEKGRNLSSKILRYNLNIKEIANLKTELTGNLSSAIVAFVLAQKWENIGNKDKAISILEEFIDDHPRNEYISIMRDFLKRTQGKKKTIELKVGVILPLSSEFAEQAQGILAGIKYAQYKFNQNSKFKIRLVVKNSEGSIMKCIKSTRELVKDEKIIAIIGELESEKTASIAPIIDYSGVPLIAPIASENGLATLSKYLFQVNGDLERRATFLAEFAINRLHHKTYATLAPADNYGKEMTDSFTATIDKLGGKIVAQKWYYENTQDLGRQFKSIRELGFNRMNKDSLIDEYTKNLTPMQKSKFKEEAIPVTSIDAIFFPIYTEDIKYVVPQFAFANVRAQILGGQYWYNINELSNKNVVAHVDTIIFESDYFFDDDDPKFHNFRSDFRKVIGRTPGVMECYGYDAMLLITEAIGKNNITREAIKNYLDNLVDLKGIRGPITFKNNNRVNSGQRIITFQKGKFVALK